MMKHRNSSELLAYWDRARGGRSLPMKSDIDPMCIPKVLPHIFVIEVGAASASFRLAGTSICSIQGRELKGSGFAALWSPDSRRQVEVLVAGAVKDGIGAVLGSRASNGTEEMNFETIILPLASLDGSKVVIGAMSPIGTHWSLGAKPMGEHAITTMRTLVKGRTSPGALRAAGLDGGEQVSFIDFARRGRVPEGVPTRRVKHLVVIEGGA